MNWTRLLFAAAAWEGGWWLARVVRRKSVYEQALAHARCIGLPLLVVGAPDAGATTGPGCGDVSVDLLPSSCAVHLQADITKKIPMPDNSVVAFVSCVLEYVSDVDAAMAELHRVAGDRIYVVRVEPWTLAAYLYPGAQRTLPAATAQLPTLPATCKVGP